MNVDHDVSFAELTTIRTGGPAPVLLTAETDDEIVEAIQSHAADAPLVLGGGSNLLVADEGVSVPVVRVATSGIEVMTADDTVDVRVAAGEPWDEFVERAVAEGWAGVECLAGIPGLVGATPIQNVGAYGQEVSDVLVDVEAFDRAAERCIHLSATECGFGYRTSTFKASPNSFVVLSVLLRLRRSLQASPIRYAELAARLQVGKGDHVSLTAVRNAVLSLRTGKGMVLDQGDHDTWSLGSFFTNPILVADEAIPADAPQWPQPDGRVKVSAAWLIERAGLERGFGGQVGRGAVTVSTKHTLALTNRGEGTTTEVLELARLIRDRVHDQYGITLEPEPTLVGAVL